MKKKKLKQIKLVYYTYKLIKKICKKQFFVIICMSIITGILPIMSLLITQNIFNILQEMVRPFNEILRLLVLYGILTLVGLLVRHLYSYNLDQLSMTLGYKINYIIMKKCSKLPFVRLESSETYDMITRITNEAISKPYQSLIAIIGVFVSLLSLIPASVIIFIWNKWIFLLLFFSSVMMFKYNLKIASYEFNIKQERCSKERKSWYYTYLLTHDVAFKEVKILNLKDYFLNRYKGLIKLFIKQESKINRIKLLSNLLLSVAQDSIVLSVTFLSIKQVYMGRLLIGNAMTYISSIALIQSSITELATNIYLLYNSNLFMSVLKDFLDSEEEREEGKIKIRDINNITIENLCFNYPLQKDVLSNVSFKIKKGEVVAIVGKNGSGKTTLLKIMCSLYYPSKGKIKINDIDLKEIDAKSYKRQISVLFQDFLKFEGTLLENVHIGDIEKNINNKEIYNVLQSAGVDFCLKGEEYDYDKSLGSWFDEGSQLSGGQWQKIALARVYYKKASLYFLDEPSSALDVESEMKVFNSFFSQSANAIGVYITHRVKIAQRAHKIIVIDKGSIVGIGNHEYLYSNCPEYKKLCLLEQSNL